MTHISKHELKPAHLRKLYVQLCTFLGQNAHKDIDRTFNELLGKEEKVMLAKRFAAIVMLYENNSNYRVAQLLQMSPSTVQRLRTNMHAGRYEHVLHALTRNKKTYEAIWLTLEDVLRAGMPPRGRGRWKSVFNRLGRPEDARA